MLGANDNGEQDHLGRSSVVMGLLPTTKASKRGDEILGGVSLSKPSVRLATWLLQKVEDIVFR